MFRLQRLPITVCKWFFHIQFKENFCKILDVRMNDI